LTWTAGPLDAGSTATATLTFVPRVLGVLTNEVLLQSTFADPENPNLGSTLLIPVVDTPTMSLEVQGNKMVISWPIAAEGFILEVTDQLTPPVFWTEERNAQVVVDGMITVTIKTSGGPKYYRLRKFEVPAP
jgi:hypothetical protein